MTLGVGSLNNNNSLYTANSGLVSNAELEKVSQELFAVAQRSVKSTDTNLSQINFGKVSKGNTGLNIFDKNINVQTANDIAKNKSGFDVQLSQSAVSNLAALRTEAAKAQFAGIHKKVEGKLHTPSELSTGSTDLKEVFALNNAPQLFNTGNLDKNKKGSNPFVFVAKQQNNEEKEQRISIFA